MKKIFKMMMAVVAGVAALTACTNEPEEGVTPTPDNEGKIVLVTVGLGDETRSTFNDGESIKWSIGDVIDYKGTKNSNSQSFTLNESMLSSDGYSATLGITITDPTLEATGFFTYHKWADNEFAMTNSNAVNANRTQSEAGVMNTDWLFLHSGLEQIVIPANADSYKLEMEIVGTIFRVIPYTTTYNDETIQSVMMMSNSDMVGTVRYWREVAEPYYEAPLWGNSKFLDITLETPFSLEGVTSAETSKGIYFPVSATKEGAPLNGYKYVVTTDKAMYTFDAMDKELVVAENTVKNVLLNLERGARLDNSAPKGTLKYEGELKDENNVSHTGCTDLNISWWYAMTKDTDAAEYVKREGAEYTAYYENVVFTYADKETGEPVDWLSVRYNDGGNSAWLLTVEPQEVGAAARSATITATYSDVNGYVIEDAYKTKTITINQMEYINGNVVTFDRPGMYDFTVSSDAIDNAEVAALLAYNWWCIPMINGVSTTDKLSDPEVQKLCRNTTFTCHIGSDIGPVADWISFGYPTDEGGNVTDFHPYISVDRNTGDQRSVLVVMRFTTPDGYIYNGEAVEDKFICQFLITQEAYSAEIVATLNNVYDGTVSYEGDDITVGTLALTADDEAVADANEFCNVAINGGASVVLAANGTITATIPANASIEAKEYTVTIKDKSGNKLVEDVTINQEANPEGGEDTTPAYTYTIVRHNGNGDDAIWGINANQKNGADFTIRDIKLDGNAVTLTQETAEHILDLAFEVTGERPATGWDHMQPATNHIYLHVVYFNGSEMAVGVCATADATGYMARIAWVSSDGAEEGNWFVFGT